jgi:UDP-glucose 4-epimerase
VKFLVTGGCGFIGTNLVKTLLAQGHQVSVLDREPKNAIVAGVVQIDIRDELVYKLCEGVEVIVHLAAETGVQPSVEDPRKDMEVNVSGTFNLLQAAALHKVKRFIFASSGTVLGRASPPFKEDSYGRPTSPYGASKSAGEAYCSAFYHSYGLETVVLRFSNIYGPYAWHKQNLFIKFIKAALKEEPLHIYGDGRQTRDFLYVKDLVDAIILASTVPDIGGQVFQISSGKETSILTLLRMMGDISLDEIAQEVEYTHEPPRPGEAKRSYAYNYYAKLMLGWKPKYSLVEGMTETFRWYLRNYYYE